MKAIKQTNNKSVILSRLHSVFFLPKTPQNTHTLDSVLISNSRRQCIQDSKSFANESLSDTYCTAEDRINQMQIDKRYLL